MDAEAMLNELIGNANAVGYLTASDVDSSASIRRVINIRDQLLPLIRAGLALQRLEKFFATAGAQMAVYKMPGSLMAEIWKLGGNATQFRGEKPTLADAINAALDAAGEGE